MARRKKTAAERAAGKLTDLIHDRNQAAASVNAIDQVLAGAGSSLVTMPQLATVGPDAGADTSVTRDGVGGVPETGEGAGFLATFWPLLLGLAGGLLAFFFFGWSWWASALAGVTALILGRVGAAFFGGYDAAAGEG